MSVSAEVIEARLRAIREAGDCPMQLPPVVRPWDPATGTGFLSNAPHRVGIAHLRLRPRFMLLDPTGTGKTPQTLVAYGTMWAQTNRKLRMLVLCGKTAQFQWVEAVEKFLNGPRAKVVGYTATGRRTSEDLRLLDYHDTSYDVLVTTYETFANDIDTIRDLDLPNTLLVADEAHKVRGTSQSKLRPAIRSISEELRAFWILTASAVYRNLTDLYGLADLLRPGMLGTPTAFANRYMDRVWVTFGKHRRGVRAPGKWHVKAYRRIDELRAVLDPWMLSRPVSAFEGQIPDFRVTESQVDLDADHRALYQDVVQKRFPGGGVPMDPLAAVTYTQMVCDAPQVLGLQTVRPPAKLTELVRLLKEEYVGDKVLVFSRYATVCRWLSEELGKAGHPAGLLIGEMNAAERLAALRAFQDGAHPQGGPDPAPSPRSVTSTTDVLVLSAAGGESLNLQQARVLVLYDLPWQAGSLLQILGRNRRHGSQHPYVLFHRLTAVRTADEATAGVLIDQLNLIHSIRLHSNSTNPTTSNSNSTVEAATDDSSSAVAIAGAIARSMEVRGANRISTSTGRLEALIRAVTGSRNESLEASRTGSRGQFPSCEEHVNANPSSTSTPAGGSDGEP